MRAFGLQILNTAAACQQLMQDMSSTVKRDVIFALSLFYCLSRDECRKAMRAFSLLLVFSLGNFWQLVHAMSATLKRDVVFTASPWVA